jgi:hypothetical protein
LLTTTTTMEVIVTYVPDIDIASDIIDSITTLGFKIARIRFTETPKADKANYNLVNTMILSISDRGHGHKPLRFKRDSFSALYAVVRQDNVLKATVLKTKPNKL